MTFLAFIIVSLLFFSLHYRIENINKRHFSLKKNIERFCGLKVNDGWVKPMTPVKWNSCDLKTAHELNQTDNQSCQNGSGSASSRFGHDGDSDWVAETCFSEPHDEDGDGGGTVVGESDSIRFSVEQVWAWCRLWLACWAGWTLLLELLLLLGECPPHRSSTTWREKTGRRRRWRWRWRNSCRPAGGAPQSEKVLEERVEEVEVEVMVVV